MELQSALLLIGLVIVAAVGLGAYDTARVKSRLAKLKSQPPPATAAAPKPKIRVPAPRAQGDKIISADKAPAPPSPQNIADSKFYEELADLEHVAVMPLSLGLAPGAEAADSAAVQTLPDNAIDFVVNLPGAVAVNRDRVLAVYKQNEYLLEKPRYLYGLRYGTGVWTNLERDPETMRYSDIAVAIQLLDGGGPIGESELNTFAQLCLKLADTLQRPTKFSLSFEQALERAHELHRFCETFDVFANINLVPVGTQGFNGRVVERAAVRAGMEFGAMNIFHMKNNLASGSQHLFSMANLFHPGEFNLAKLDHTAIHGLTLFMSVPGVQNPVRVFDKMTETAKTLCEMTGAKMLDHDRRALTQQGLSIIRSQIEQLTVSMQNFGVAPGSATALRLFFNS